MVRDPDLVLLYSAQRQQKPNAERPSKGQRSVLVDEAYTVMFFKHHGAPPFSQGVSQRTTRDSPPTRSSPHLIPRNDAVLPDREHPLPRPPCGADHPQGMYTGCRPGPRQPGSGFVGKDRDRDAPTRSPRPSRHIVSSPSPPLVPNLASNYARYGARCSEKWRVPTCCAHSCRDEMADGFLCVRFRGVSLSRLFPSNRSLPGLAVPVRGCRSRTMCFRQWLSWPSSLWP